MKRVVVTGLGLVTPLAGSVNKSWDKLINAESGIGKIEGFNVEDLPAKIAGHVPNSEYEDGFDPKEYDDSKPWFEYIKNNRQTE